MRMRDGVSDPLQRKRRPNLRAGTHVLEVWDRHVDDVVELLCVLEIFDDLLGLLAEALVERERVGSLLVLHLKVVLEQVDDALIPSLEQHQQILDHHSEGEHSALVLQVVSVELDRAGSSEVSDTCAG